MRNVLISDVINELWHCVMWEMRNVRNEQRVNVLYSVYSQPCVLVCRTVCNVCYCAGQCVMYSEQCVLPYCTVYTMSSACYSATVQCVMYSEQFPACYCAAVQCLMYNEQCVLLCSHTGVPSLALSTARPEWRDTCTPKRWPVTLPSLCLSLSFANTGGSWVY